MTPPLLDPRRRRALEARTRAVAAVHDEDSSPVALPARSPLVETTVVARPTGPVSHRAAAAPRARHVRETLGGPGTAPSTSPMWAPRSVARRRRRWRIAARVAATVASGLVLAAAGWAWLAPIIAAGHL